MNEGGKVAANKAEKRAGEGREKRSSKAGGNEAAKEGRENEEVKEGGRSNRGG